ncbi:DUF2490 domain-containing protein [Flavobacterium zhairuonense]|uniref:DUF2490 domain-containing protein n=1 Tax=Flavobacterium zhairuonense TaxID=2493631 RepID=UPI001043C89B|nr:DUF2490 domain-containing protein [Flavobacterium zhairuonense]KAF2508661.1 DUF2490 domain-containing protein [Flavobacterium zhairuonense]
MNSLSKCFLAGMMGILAQFPLFGQTEKLQQFWNEYAFVHDLNQKWAIEADAGLTSSGVPQHNTIFYGFTQFNLRAWVHYYPADRWKLSFFGAYYFNVNVPELNQNEAPEYRFALQATYNLLKHGRLSVNLRGRIEDRNIENESGIFEAVERFRFQGRAVYFLNGQRKDKNEVYAFFSDELYFKTQSEISGDEFFDRNRITLGLGYRATKDFQIEISYANEYLPRAAVDKVYNALQVNVTFNNLVSNAIKPFMRKKASVDDGAPSGGGG